jgi:hypothetical protein
MVDTNFSSHLCNPRNIIRPKRCMFYPGNLRGQSIPDFFIKETWGYEESRPSSVVFCQPLFVSFSCFIVFMLICNFHLFLLLVFFFSCGITTTAGSWADGC